MNLKVPVLAVSFGVLILFLSQSALAFYNPTQGRWLSRDPIAEQGGINLKSFADNDPVARIDHLGLLVPDLEGQEDAIIGAWLRFHGKFEKPNCGTCGGAPLPRTHCCCNGQHVAKAPIKTGIVKHVWHQNPQGAGPVHVWLTWVGGSADSNADEMTRPPGNGKVASPADWTRPDEDPGNDPPEHVMLSPCEYDFGALNTCLSTLASAYRGRRVGDCRLLPDILLNACKKVSRGCTVP
jgi:hypothetical protein